MSVKPYSPSHIAAVASTYTNLRISGDVKEQLVDLLVSYLETRVKSLEEQTIDSEPERKTLDDPDRTRLNYNRTRELALERLTKLESVGSAAVCRLIDDLEDHLSHLIRLSEQHASQQRVGTIKPRHLEKAKQSLKIVDSNSIDSQNSEMSTPLIDPLDEVIESSNTAGGILTTSTLRTLSRSFARLPVEDEALEELMLTYYDRSATMEEDLRGTIAAGSVHSILDHIHQLRTFLSLGWMKKRLARAGSVAQKEGATRVTIHHVLQSESEF